LLVNPPRAREAQNKLAGSGYRIGDKVGVLLAGCFVLFFPTVPIDIGPLRNHPQIDSIIDAGDNDLRFFRNVSQGSDDPKIRMGFMSHIAE
jgi:hypothetical protein